MWINSRDMIKFNALRIIINFFLKKKLRELVAKLKYLV